MPSATHFASHSPAVTHWCIWMGYLDVKCIRVCVNTFIYTTHWCNHVHLCAWLLANILDTKYTYWDWAGAATRSSAAACAFSIIFCSATNLAEHTHTHWNTHTIAYAMRAHISVCCAWSNTHTWACESVYTSTINFCIRLFELFMRVGKRCRRCPPTRRYTGYAWNFSARTSAHAHITLNVYWISFCFCVSCRRVCWRHNSAAAAAYLNDCIYLCRRHWLAFLG